MCAVVFGYNLKKEVWLKPLCPKWLYYLIPSDSKRAIQITQSLSSTKRNGHMGWKYGNDESINPVVYTSDVYKLQKQYPDLAYLFECHVYI